ncbi:hypothetical protein SLEP1_g7947 [Rubroshorea leprosula]|uniref:Uncharacterized protein n=1 Tax=Rubroshorea leprosula TaxID=152421 RepID=A0AAV5I4K7_9ROSI|nr:hypothetical protein SLEP1_g7947 [Rubroshorea leprosula]
MAAAKSDEARDKIVSEFSKIQKQNTTTGLRTCNNILAMTKKRTRRNEAEGWLAARSSVSGVKRPANAGNGSGNMALKKGRGADGLENHLVNRALEGISYGGRTGARGRSRGKGRGRGWGGRGRGRGYR